MEMHFTRENEIIAEGVIFDTPASVWSAGSASTPGISSLPGNGGTNAHDAALWQDQIRGLCCVGT